MGRSRRMNAWVPTGGGGASAGEDIDETGRKTGGKHEPSVSAVNSYATAQPLVSPPWAAVRSRRSRSMLRRRRVLSISTPTENAIAK